MSRVKCHTEKNLFYYSIQLSVLRKREERIFLTVSAYPANTTVQFRTGSKSAPSPLQNTLYFFPSFDYFADYGEVMGKVKSLALSYNPNENGGWWIPVGYEWNEAVCPDYRRHFHEAFGYEALRPTRKV